MKWRRDSDGESAGEEPRVVVRDKRRIDPVTGEMRVPSSSEQQAGGSVQVEEGAIGGAAGGTGQVGVEELDNLRAQLEERTGDLQRLSAEYANYRRRVERDRQVVIASAKAQVAGELLTVLDDIERAEAHGDLSGAFKAVADKVVAGLTAQGLEPFGAAGDAFDPELHEAVQHTTSTEVDGPTVSTVLRRGYRFGERVLRPAMVVVTDAEVADTTAGPAAEPEPASRDAARFVAAESGSNGGDPLADSGASPGGEPGAAPSGGGRPAQEE